MTLEKEKAVCANTTAAIDACNADYNPQPEKAQDENSLLKSALSFVNTGYCVFPVKPNDKRPLTSNGLNDASHHIQVIRQWWQQWPQANIGIRTGSLSGFFVLDIDGDDGENSLSKLEQQHTPLPPTHEVITGGGGRHLYFKMPEYGQITNSAGRLGLGLDIRGDGGYVVAPPSIHASGRAYTWSVDSADSMAQAPEWLIKLIQEPKQPDYSIEQKVAIADLVKGVSEGQRNDSLARVAGKLFHSNVDKDLATGLCLAVNDARFTPPLPHDEVVRTVNSIARVNASNKQQAAINGEIGITAISDIPMKPIKWLWPNRIACGKVTVIAGNPGLGKSQITASIAAIVTRGLYWPVTGEKAAVGSVVFLSAEDNAADTIRPRLEAVGADLTRCQIIGSLKINCPDKGIVERSIDLGLDVGKIFETIRKIEDVRLIVIDPVSAYLGKVDGNSNSDIRGLLAPLSDMAAERGIAILLLTHLNKSNQQDMMGRIIGSIGLIAAARSGFVVVKDEENHEIRYFLPIKNNIGEDRYGFAYKIEGMTLNEEIKTSRICWQDGLFDAKTILEPKINGKGASSQDAQSFLKDLLSMGAMSPKDIFQEAKAAGFSEGQIRTAKKNLGIKPKKRGMNSGWEWKLNSYAEGSEDTEDACA